MHIQSYKYDRSMDIYFYFGFGGITVFIGILFLLAPIVFPLAFILFGVFLIITGIACLVQGILVRYWL